MYVYNPIPSAEARVNLKSFMLPSPTQRCGSLTMLLVRLRRDVQTLYEPNHAPLLGLAAKPFAPVVPLSVLTLAGALPDVVFFILQFFGVETFNFDPTLQRRGCFPYSNEYPYSHSLLGMVVAGMFRPPINPTMHVHSL